MQPRLHFLTLAITLQLGGWGGDGEEKGRIYQPQTFLRPFSRDATATPLPATWHYPSTLGGRAGIGKQRVGSTSHKPFFDLILGMQPQLHFLPLTISLQPWGVGLGKKRVGSTSHKPFFDLILGMQPRLHFLPLTISLQPWGWGGAREEKGRIYQPQTFLRPYPRDATATPLPATYHQPSTLGGGVGQGKKRVGSTSHKPFFDLILGTQPRLHFLQLLSTILYSSAVHVTGYATIFVSNSEMNLSPAILGTATQSHNHVGLILFLKRR